MAIGKRVLFGISLVLCASLALAESVRVKATSANLRSAPMATAKVIAKVSHGKMLEVIEVSGVWTRVTDGTVTGWVSSSLVERVAEAPAAPAASSAAASRSSAPATTSRKPARRAVSEEKKLNFGGGATFATKSVGFGLHGRALFTPSPSMSSLRVLGAVDIFLKEGRGWQVLGNGIYVFKLSNPDFRPYAGAGVVHARASGLSDTDLNIIGGVQYKQRFFLDGRYVLESGSPFFFSAGITF